MSDHQRPGAAGGEPQTSGRTVDRLADSFLVRLRRGEKPSIDQYAARFPQLADEIRDVLSTLLLLEDGADAFQGDSEVSKRTATGPETLGEYRILREIGRGGMGIVFEAEHNTLRRRVALKVLPLSLTPDDQRRKRFDLEARLAGRLHHTNIVPVFEVGTDQGFHFYAMQYIQGQNLDVVISELKHWREQALPGHKVSADAQDTTEVRSESRGIGWILHSGAFLSGSSDPEVVDTIATPSCRETPFGQEITPAAVSASPRVRTREVAGSETRPYSRASSYRQETYFHRLAHVGLQIAEALQYAHAQGVIHRDIKPANIILDIAGVAWVTDFGLAKNEDEELTRSGDVVGTMRYMSPERFRGQADFRSDLYGVGLTLYELCTLRPAFDANDRAQLIEQICHAEPMPPRQINPQIPLDLETIILKAMEKSADQRYRSAGELAEDLRLFLADRPIQARPVSSVERLWRWCRRNPQQAALAACVLLLLSVVTAGSLAFGYVSSLHSRQLAASERESTERLYESLQRSAEAARWSRRPGQSMVSVEEIARAVQILPQFHWQESRVEAERRKLRNAAIAALALPDIASEKTWRVTEPWTSKVIFSSDHTRYALADRQGTIVIREVDSDQELQRLAAPETVTSLTRFSFDPEDRYLGVIYQSRSGLRFGFWDIASGKLSLIPGTVAQTASFLFTPDDRHVFLLSNARLLSFDLATAQLAAEVTLSSPSRLLTLNASGDRLAVVLSRGPRIQLFETAQLEPCGEFAAPAGVSAIAWHPQWGQLALGTEDGILQIHEMDQTLQVSQRFQGHSGRIHQILFADSGHHLISQSWDGTVRLWNVGTGDQMLRMDGVDLASSNLTSDKSSYLGTSDRSQFQLWRMDLNPPLRILRSHRGNESRWSADFDASGKWLASARDDGVEIWSTEQGQRVAFLPFHRSVRGASKDVKFVPGAEALLASNGEGLTWLPYRVDRDGTFSVSRDAASSLYGDPSTWISIDDRAQHVAFRQGTQGNRALIVDVASPDQQVVVGPHAGIDHVELSPDGRWLASSCWGGRGVHLWHPDTGQRVTQHLLEPYATKSNVTFSPDSTWLTASTPKYFVSWRVEDLSTRFRVLRPIQDDWPGPLAYSPDGRLILAAHSRFQLALLDAASGEELAILDASSNVGFHDCDFSDDGKLLVAASDTNLHLWDLHRLRSSLKQVGLDW